MLILIIFLPSDIGTTSKNSARYKEVTELERKKSRNNRKAVVTVSTFKEFPTKEEEHKEENKQPETEECRRYLKKKRKYDEMKEEIQTLKATNSILLEKIKELRK